MLSDHQQRGTAPAHRGLHPDEKVWELRERVVVDSRTPGAVPVRVQSLRVLRNDRLVWFDRVMGPEAAFTGSLIEFWAAFEYSAGEVVEIAERLREGKPEQTEPSDLIGDYLKELDEKRQLAARRTTSGPYLTVQRD